MQFSSCLHLQFLFLAQSTGCELVFADQGRKPFSFEGDKPKIFKIGDDTTLSMGPDGFHQPSLQGAIRSAAVFCIISCAAYPQIYALMAHTAMTYRKDVMIVETRLKHEADWYNFIERLEPTKNILLATVGGGHA